MLRSSLLTASTLLLCATASAQQQVKAMKVPGPVRSAGVYHVVTGTWDRSGQQANISATKIFSADTPSGYFGVGWETSEGIDEGIIPGTGNNEFGGVGTADEYFVDGFDFSYCTQEPASVGFTVNLYDSYVTCDYPDAAGNFVNCNNQAGSINVSGAPGGAVNACWIATIDLAGGGEVCMDADGGTCNPGFDGAASGLDHFGWGLDMDAATYTGVFTGPILEGYDPMWAVAGEGTCYNAGPGCGGGGNNEGAGSGDLFGIGSPLSGCFFFGGYLNTKGCGGPMQSPPGQMSFNLYADCVAPCAGGPCYTTYCNPGDGQGPNNNATSTATSCSLSAGVTLNFANADTNQNGYVVMGNGQNSAQSGQGTICVVGGGCLARYAQDVKNTGAGGTASLDLSNTVSGGPNYGIPNCGGVITAGQTWNFQFWHRLQAGSWSFSEAITIPFVN